MRQSSGFSSTHLRADQEGRIMFEHYRVCEACGTLVDKWSYHTEQINGVEQSFFICSDCEDTYSPEEINKFVGEMRKGCTSRNISIPCN